MPVSSLFLFTMCSFTKNMHVTTSYMLYANYGASQHFLQKHANMSI